MSIARFFSRMDDWINPIVVKELRQAVRSRVVIAALFLFLLLQLGLIGIYVLNTEISGQRDVELFNAGRDLFRILQGILLGTCLLIPAYAGLRLGAERSDTNVDLLFISTLRPRAIISGKLISAVVLVLLVFSACTPFMTFTYLLRGLDIPSMLTILAIDFLVALAGIQIALFLAVIPAPPAVRGLFIIVGLVNLIGLFSSATSGTSFMLEVGTGASLDSREFWGPWLVSALISLSMIGLLFVWSVAILSPPSANRSLPVRLYLVAFWLVTGAAVAWISSQLKVRSLIDVWLSLSGWLFALQILISINEREQWGPRVARTIPRRWWLRAPAFLFYSGSAGGILFGVLMLSLTLGSGLVLLARNATWIGSSDLTNILKVLLLVGLYTYCYGMSAVLLRATLFARQLKPNATWVIALLLVGMGCVMPYTIAYFLYPEALRYSRRDELWQLTDPFTSVNNALSGPVPKSSGTFDLEGVSKPDLADVFEAPVLPFLVIWAGLVTLLAIPWLLQQLGQFHPPERDHTRAARKDSIQVIEVVEVPEVLPVDEASATP